jgi:hypothetical protein
VEQHVDDVIADRRSLTAKNGVVEQVRQRGRRAIEVSGRRRRGGLDDPTDVRERRLVDARVLENQRPAVENEAAAERAGVGENGQRAEREDGGKSERSVGEGTIPIDSSALLS